MSETTTPRVVLITGGTTGIGAATAQAFRDAGYRVAVTYLGNPKQAQAFSESTGIPAFEWDAADDAACEAGIAQVTAALGPVDILVNNAGVTRDASFAKMTTEQWRQVVRNDLDSCFAMSHAVWAGMKERGWGRIISLSSVNGQAGQFGQANYSAAKAGVLGLTKALALEGARHGITVNAIAPGYVGTEMVRAVPEKVMEGIVARIPVGRIGEPSEIARCVLFLAAEEAGYITGSTLSVNGGLRMD
ncbi:acetoacetyl-CoA reductase [Novosphingobium album (ex Hu et al. 2023)]|uniref:Acetoacetyl-CoA reductase n=1 Tax=Novosphingobium album (ex Hu et al. 2023) TaxID=2930093 RepID=A0ABT0B244_9SPHN|nr:acetoacetyl-CoA reductase [Novosphingobium album (ex Hu et al. 2023)]MCJ2179090.1 acetoacetyl-CoA reductase [Novosphingobium album (ex Hu et al. 2023)]